MARHFIRLRGPWQYQPICRSILTGDGVSRPTGPSDLPAAGTIRMPSDWGRTLGNEFRGRVRYLRRFGRPTGLVSSDRVVLVFDAVDGWADIRLNDQPLGSCRQPLQRLAFDVRDRLQDRNLLEVEVELPADLVRSGRDPRQPGGMIGEVRLEIESPGE